MITTTAVTVASYLILAAACWFLARRYARGMRQIEARHEERMADIRARHEARMDEIGQDYERRAAAIRDHFVAGHPGDVVDCPLCDMDSLARD